MNSTKHIFRVKRDRSVHNKNRRFRRVKLAEAYKRYIEPTRITNEQPECARNILSATRELIRSQHIAKPEAVLRADETPYDPNFPIDDEIFNRLATKNKDTFLPEPLTEAEKILVAQLDILLHDLDKKKKNPVSNINLSE